jgi:hypothetical protein
MQSTPHLRHDAWTADKRAVEGNKKLSRTERLAQLEQIGAEPPVPLHFALTPLEPTIEGLTKFWLNGGPSLGLFSDEGGQLVGGHGINTDNRLRTGAALSKLWDGDDTGEFEAEVQGGRSDLSFAPPAHDAHDDSTKCRITFFVRTHTSRPRTVVESIGCAPDSLMGQRFHRETDPEDVRAMATYHACIMRMLSEPPKMAEGRRNELNPPVLKFSSDATVLWLDFADSVEREIKPDRDFAQVSDFASKAAEHAARIAGVLTIAESPGASEISGATLDRAIAIVEWYLHEARRLAASLESDGRLVRADKLLQWIKSRAKEGEILARPGDDLMIDALTDSRTDRPLRSTTFRSDRG